MHWYIHREAGKKCLVDDDFAWALSDEWEMWTGGDIPGEDYELILFDHIPTKLLR